MLTKMSKPENVFELRPVEARIYEAYNKVVDRLCVAFDFLANLGQYFKKLEYLLLKLRYGTVKNKLGGIELNYHYEFVGEGKIKRVKGKPIAGEWLYRDGKEIYIGNPQAILDIYTAYPWKEAWNGFYDEALGTHVESKQHFRKLMKEKGLIPYEKNLYGKSPALLKREKMQESMQKREKAMLAAFKEKAGNIDFDKLREAL